MSDSDIVVFHYDTKNDSDSIDSNTSSETRRRRSKEGVKSYVLSVPSNKKTPKVKNGTLREIDINATLEQIDDIIEHTEAIIENINQITVHCCNNSRCGSWFSRCFKMKPHVSVKTGDVKTSII